MDKQPRQVEEQVEQVAQAIGWIHDESLSAHQLVTGPWTALIADPVETPPAIRLAGQYIARGFLRHASGRSLSRDFPGNTWEEALLQAKRWVEGSIRMWLQALQDTAQGTETIVRARQLPQNLGMAILQAAFDSLKVSQAKGHLPPNAPVGIDAMQPEAQPPVAKGDQRKRRKRMRRKGR